MRTSNENERKIDLHYHKEGGLIYRLTLRLARPVINRVCKSVIGRAYERGLVDSFVLHELAAIIDRSLWPKRYNQKPVNR